MTGRVAVRERGRKGEGGREREREGRKEERNTPGGARSASRSQ